jgi:MraZ protein
MANLIGEYDCKLDAKGRIMMPSALKRQIAPEANNSFVINRGFERCLVLYPQDVWKVITEEINVLNLYNKKNRDFARYFYRGATELQPDTSNRLLLPKPLLSYAGIQKDVVLFAYSNRIEIWSKEIYDGLMTSEPEDFASLAEDVMGRKSTGEIKGENVS